MSSISKVSVLRAYFHGNTTTYASRMAESCARFISISSNLFDQRRSGRCVSLCKKHRMFSSLITPTNKVSATIKGLGAYVPKEVRSNAFWSNEVVKEWGKQTVVSLQKGSSVLPKDIHPVLIDALKTHAGDPFVGMKERRVSRILPSQMEIAAALDALKDASLYPEDIDLLLSFSIPSDRIIPPNVFKIHHELGLKNAKCFEVNSLCHSFLTMMDIASQYIQNNNARNVLAVTSTTYSAIMDFTAPESVMSGDGAAAAVIGPCSADKGIQLSRHFTESKYHETMILARREPRICNPSEYAFSEHQSNERLFFTMFDVPGSMELVSKLPFWIENTRPAFFKETGFSPEDIDLMIPNAATTWYSKVLSELFGIPLEKFQDNILKYSNMAGVNLPMNLYTAYKNGRVKNGDLVFLWGHGGGASHGGMLLRWFKETTQENIQKARRSDQPAEKEPIIEDPSDDIW